MSEIKVGIIVPLTQTPEAEFQKAKDMGFDNCQLVCWNEDLFTDHYARLVTDAVSALGIQITAFWCGWPGPALWNFEDGPVTLGLVPSAYRFIRMNTLVKGSDFASKINVQDLVTHVGFIPENPSDPEYMGVVNAVRFVAQHCGRNHQHFVFETGQETPTTLKRLIQDIHLDNLGINLDPANLLLYGKGNPVDALDVFGEYIRGVHAKDGEYPTDARYLGQEKPLGQGRVNFPLLLSKLKEIGYKGSLTIEREISGAQQTADIKMGKDYLESLLK